MKPLNDYPRLAPDVPDAVLAAKTVEGLQQLLASERPEHIVVSGTRKSHGGHLSFRQPHAVLNMKSLSAIEGLEGSIVRVQAGCTWQQVQDYLQPHGLSPLCQQSSYDFTIGGSIAGNIHGRDIRHSTIEHSIEWMEAVFADGSLHRLSRTKQPDIFWNLFGSQGMLGIIVRVGLRVTANNLMTSRSQVVQLNKLNEWFEAHQDTTTFFIARPDMSGGMKRVLVTTWQDTGKVSYEPLGKEKNWRRDKLIFWLSTKSNVLMRGRWILENMVSGKHSVSRSNAMRPPTVALKMFATHSPRYSYVVQEIFIPKQALAQSIESINRLNRHRNEAVLAGVTIRHIGKQEAPLRQVPQGEGWAIMQYWKLPRNQIGLGRYAWLQSQLASICQIAGGSVNLSYASYQDAETILNMYPNLRPTLLIKSRIDPDSIFTSDFIQKLLRTSARK